ncbi:MAG: hypothetical protein IPJ13_20520 [Saprospiraceae bacterium]|nr:hypothetical protein [Saprospiraceae bacterium]
MDACAHLADMDERKKVQRKINFYHFIFKHKISKSGERKGVTGVVYAQFVVNKKGEIDDKSFK